MEEIGISRLEGMGNSVRRKRSLTIRRPRPDPIQKFPEIHDHSSSTPPSDDTSKVSGDEPAGSDINSRRKEFSLNQCTLRRSYSREGDLDESGLNHQQHSDGVIAPSRSRSTTKLKGLFELHSGTASIHGERNGEIERFGQSRPNANEAVKPDKVKKVKLKVGGVTHSFQTASNNHSASGSGSSKKSSDAPRARQKLILQENSDDDLPPNKSNHAREISLTDFTRRNNSSSGKAEFSAEKMPQRSATGNTGVKADPVRKSKRVPKKRLLSDDFDEEDDDDEIRYLEKLKYSKLAAGRKDSEVESRKKQRVSNSRISEDFVSSKKSTSERGSEDTYDEEEAVPDDDPEGKKNPRSDSIDSTTETKREQALTSRQRALLSSKDASSTPGASVIEFPNGLPPAPPRKQKEKLTEVEQQLKKAEAAQRRKLQVEKAARESEAEAIRKILGQDSSRKKKEDKIKKRQEELAQERAANAHTLPSNTIRLVMSPAGTVVTFSNDMGFPSIFDPKPSSYPPPREKCAGPSCCNPFKYRDSKSKLPLCSLQCYKAVHAKMQDEATTG